MPPTNQAGMPHPETAAPRTVEWSQLGLLGLLTILLFGFAREHHPLLVVISFGSLVLYHVFGDRWFASRQLRGLPAIGHFSCYLLLCSFVIWVTTEPMEESAFWLVFLLPVVVAGSRVGLLGTSAIAAGATALYFLLLPEGLIRSQEFHEELPEFLIIAAVFFFVGLLVQILSQETRRQLTLQRAANLALKDSLTQLAAAEEELRRRERLAALGAMAAGVAHEIRNPLGIVSASAQLLRRRLADSDGEPAELAGAILEETARLDALISEFLTFGRETRLHARPCDLAALLRGSGESFRELAAGRGVVLECDAEGTCRVLADPDLLHQALLNLYLNAVAAMPRGGTLRTRLIEKDDQVRIEVSDTGEGIPEEFRGRIFDPFFTTRDRGTGLGLANALKFVEAHGGRLLVAESSPAGTTFALILPKGGADHAPYPGG